MGFLFLICKYIYRPIVCATKRPNVLVKSFNSCSIQWRHNYQRCDQVTFCLRICLTCEWPWEGGVMKKYLWYFFLQIYKYHINIFKILRCVYSIWYDWKIKMYSICAAAMFCMLKDILRKDKHPELQPCWICLIYSFFLSIHSTGSCDCIKYELFETWYYAFRFTRDTI